MFKRFMQWLKRFTKRKLSAAELNNIRRSHNTKYEDVTK
jgi:hypothetical protein